MFSQINDTITIKDKSYKLLSCPLEQYWRREDNKPPGLGTIFSKLKDKGYIASWKIENSLLYLIDFYGEQADVILTNPYYLLKNRVTIKKLLLTDIFPDTKGNVFAEWYTGQLVIPFSKQTDSSTEFSKSRNEYEITLYVEKGFIIDGNVN